MRGNISTGYTALPTHVCMYSTDLLCKRYLNLMNDKWFLWNLRLGWDNKRNTLTKLNTNLSPLVNKGNFTLWKQSSKGESLYPTSVISLPNQIFFATRQNRSSSKNKNVVIKRSDCCKLTEEKLMVSPVVKYKLSAEKSALYYRDETKIPFFSSAKQNGMIFGSSVFVFTILNHQFDVIILHSFIFEIFNQQRCWRCVE